MIRCVSNCTYSPNALTYLGSAPRSQCHLCPIVSRCRVLLVVMATKCQLPQNRDKQMLWSLRRLRLVHNHACTCPTTDKNRFVRTILCDKQGKEVKVSGVGGLTGKGVQVSRSVDEVMGACGASV
ncbi:hypothetical protein C0Q70_06221 [Pomacea canaliculata]|uniref:Uncharacterized protein n=1 Tax=Pomacea canaliculata TaxID=400727 RepID=A0A2T7PNE6_POMCA|nr:hypothetical protein C0Q70_06221 [Pomacea canaliculata]